ncbi:MAG: multiheme c-type cytochrome, partial [Acidobacteriota bacterium]
LGDLRRLERVAEAGRLPREMKTSFLSSIAEKESAAAAPVEPYAIHTLADGTADPPVRIGVLAVSPLGGGPVEHYRTLEPAEALRRYLPQVERESDIVVLLTRTTDAEIAKLAAAFPAVDVIINGSPTGHGRELARAGNTVIVESAYNAIAIGILELQWDARGRITSYQNQFMPLVPLIADSAPMLALVERSRQAYSAYKEEEARKVPPPSVPSIFAGSGACAECHEEAYRAWEKSGHARAVGVLKDSMNLYNDKCLGCHVTAFQAGRGFVNMLHTPELANVHCEACHGASTDHMKNPKEIHPGIGAMQQIRRPVPREFCLRCHTPEDSPKFDYDTYWAKIRH